MKKMIQEADIKKASDSERCQLILAIIKRTGRIHKGGIIGGTNNKRNKERKLQDVKFKSKNKTYI